MNRNLTVRTHETGAANTWLIVGVVFIVTTIGLGAAFGWALMNYLDQKDNVDTKVSSAVTSAVKTQADKDAATFEAEEKKPNRTFAGPEDFGAVSFDYPKTWSAYIANDASSSSTYQAYLHPVSVPQVLPATQFALRMTIETKDYDAVLTGYAALVKKGDLQSSTVKVNGVDSTRLDGSFSKDLRGSAVVFKLRDKTVTIRTDAETFKADFDTLIATIKFNS